jgi:hypothetical protein
MTTEAPNKPKQSSDAKPEAVSNEKAVKILRRAEKGDESILPELCALLDDGASGSRIIETYGSPADWLERRLTQQSAGDNFAVK